MSVGRDALFGTPLRLPKQTRRDTPVFIQDRSWGAEASFWNPGANVAFENSADAAEFVRNWVYPSGYSLTQQIPHLFAHFCLAAQRSAVDLASRLLSNDGWSAPATGPGPRILGLHQMYLRPPVDAVLKIHVDGLVEGDLALNTPYDAEVDAFAFRVEELGRRLNDGSLFAKFREGRSVEQLRQRGRFTRHAAEKMAFFVALRNCVVDKILPAFMQEHSRIQCRF